MTWAGDHVEAMEMTADEWCEGLPSWPDMRAVIEAAMAEDESKALTFEGADATQAQILRRTVRLQERWETSFTRLLERQWDRRRSLLLTKIRSAQFRRGTPLWDPPGSTPLAERYSVLVDVEAWKADLLADAEPMLRDLYTEAVEAMEIMESKALEGWMLASVEAFVQRWLTHIGAWTDAIAEAVRQILTTEAVRVPEVEERVDRYVARVARTATTRTATSTATGGVNQAQYEAAQQVANPITFDTDGEPVEPRPLLHRWYSARDNRVRPGHRLATGQTVPLDQPFRVRDRKGVEHSMLYPGDISAPPDLWINCRCLPGNVEVSGNIVATMSRPYEGPLIDVTLSTGHNLSATPEHPVLTLRGWVPLGSLEPGDQVVTSAAPQEATAPDPNVGHSPTTIEQAVRASRLATARGEGVHGRGMYLNGEVAYDDVDVEVLELPLPFGPEASLLQHLGQFGVPPSLTPVSRSNDPTALDWVPEAKGGRFVTGASIQPQVPHAEGDGAALDIEPPGHGQYGLSGSMAPADLHQQVGTLLTVGDPNAITTRPHRDTSPGEQRPYRGGAADSSDFGNFGQAQAGLVQVAQVVDLGRRDWSGHVYDLFTTERAFLANGILVHNCVALFITDASAGIWDRPGGYTDSFGRLQAPAKSYRPEALGFALETKGEPRDDA